MCWRYWCTTAVCRVAQPKKSARSVCSTNSLWLTRSMQQHIQTSSWLCFQVVGQRNLHEVLHDLHSSSNIIRMHKSRRLRRMAHATRMSELRYTYKILGRNWRKETTHRTKTKMGRLLKWILGKRVEAINWIHLAQDRNQRWSLVNTVLNLWVC
jgi:hypothetical protein